MGSTTKVTPIEITVACDEAATGGKLEDAIRQTRKRTLPLNVLMITMVCFAVWAPTICGIVVVSFLLFFVVYNKLRIL